MIHMSDRDVRNVVRVVYGSAVPTRVYRQPRTVAERLLTWVGRKPFEVVALRPEVEARDENSVAWHGERVAVLVFEDDLTPAEAIDLARSVLVPGPVATDWHP